MPTMAYPSLTREGYIRAPDRKANRIFTAIFASDHSQDPRYSVEITSVQWTISMYQNDPLTLEENLRDVLETVFNRYFDLAKFDVSVDPMESDPSRLDVKVKGQVVQDGLRYSFARLIIHKDGVFQSIKEITYS